MLNTEVWKKKNHIHTRANLQILGLTSADKQTTHHWTHTPVNSPPTYPVLSSYLWVWLCGVEIGTAGGHTPPLLQHVAFCTLSAILSTCAWYVECAKTKIVLNAPKGHEQKKMDPGSRALTCTGSTGLVTGSALVFLFVMVISSWAAPLAPVPLQAGAGGQRVRHCGTFTRTQIM